MEQYVFGGEGRGDGKFVYFCRCFFSYFSIKHMLSRILPTERRKKRSFRKFCSGFLTVSGPWHLGIRLTQTNLARRVSLPGRGGEFAAAALLGEGWRQLLLCGADEGIAAFGLLLLLLLLLLLCQGASAGWGAGFW